jgi:hypothetical protein
MVLSIYAECIVVSSGVQMLSLIYIECIVSSSSVLMLMRIWYIQVECIISLGEAY